MIRLQIPNKEYTILLSVIADTHPPSTTAGCTTAMETKYPLSLAIYATVRENFVWLQRADNLISSFLKTNNTFSIQTANQIQFPITRLVLGGVPDGSKSLGRFKLGKFDCHGQVNIDEPKSCKDLWRVGHVLSGFYAIKTKSNVTNVYCNFTGATTTA